MNTDVAWVALGSNLRNRGQALARLRDLLATDEVRIEAASGEILTRPLGVTGQGDFHNQVLKLRAPQRWSPRRWLEHTQAAERNAGRRDTYRWGPRLADVDILLFGENGDIEYADADLTVPHPEIDNRPFLTKLLEQARCVSSAGRPLGCPDLPTR